MSTSLDGFVAGPDVGIKHPMGRGGERLHVWMSGDAVDPRDAEMAAAFVENAGYGATVEL